MANDVYAFILHRVTVCQSHSLINGAGAPSLLFLDSKNSKIITINPVDSADFPCIRFRNRILIIKPNFYIPRGDAPDYMIAGK